MIDHDTINGRVLSIRERFVHLDRRMGHGAEGEPLSEDFTGILPIQKLRITRVDEIVQVCGAGCRHSHE
jgi:hypothetical protein